MTSPKITTLKEGDSRFYVHPETGEKVPGVTSVLNMLPKGFLKFWAAKMVAEAAVGALDGSGPDWLTPMVQADPGAAIGFLKGAPYRNTKKAADIGSAAHGLFEAMILGEPLPALTPDIVPFQRQYGDLLDKVQPEPIRVEDTVWSDTHRYGGSFDLMGRVDGRLCWIDNKTTRSGVHPEVALQLSAYRHADHVLDGRTQKPVPMPYPDEEQFGLVFHVRPEGWAVYEVPIGDDVFEYFLALRKVFVWDGMANVKARGKGIVGEPLVKGAAA